MSSDSSRNSSLAWQDLLRQHRAIAVIRTNDLNLGLEMAKAVSAGGIRLIEITWNSERPVHLIRQICEQLPNCTIGTGTVLNLEQLQEAIAAKVQFCFTPHVNPTLIQTAINADIPMIPGALSPTEITTAWQLGASCVKVFPVQAIGGVSYIKGLQGPLRFIPLIPTGGVTLDNAAAFIKAGAIAVGLSSQLFPKNAIDNKNWEVITQKAQILLQQLKPFSAV
ncbi:bifunctional 4-hydroxy-2-oxoglutarate aldolase/2-dehydro-3-deoxy-phosphogluconate aldolase [cyanobacterium endosymbiont of Epithemia turgida]|uniref:bifunctional 4-hydroxy-2-oxoglutarate aldolase/2-dehydro-3-deoxy-phosphogluconate aldolase n=1 Tax=cyanobacterium endosymbiont of Epithemia turgida TaxID=718217 RepID=UPI0005C60922|nr:bifunctional 4-hydroxy-2-oxoglutarate aldolase/2-dehydro-3-deoxy-phosphogluconate aldolase [cyanobacterium endosymbiont of Epithemia turgida]